MRRPRRLCVIGAKAGVIDLHGLLAEQAKLAASSRVQDRTASAVWFCWSEQSAVGRCPEPTIPRSLEKLFEVEASLLEILVNACLGKQILADLVIVKSSALCGSVPFVETRL